MLKKFTNNIISTFILGLAAIFYVPTNAAADNNPVVGTWAFAAFSYDSRAFSETNPAAWDRGTLTLKNDLTLEAVVSASSNGQGPQGTLKGTYTITSDGQFNAKIYDEESNDPVVISGRLDKTRDAIVASVTINPQQPALVSLVRKAVLNPDTLLGNWVGQVLVYDTENSMRWVSINEMKFKKNKVTVEVIDSNNQSGGAEGTYQLSNQRTDPGQVIMTLYSTDKGGDTMDVVAQVSASGDMATVTVTSRSLRKTVGMGTLIKR